jgi:PIN domain nuclease of toxin-antitoxin system
MLLHGREDATALVMPAIFTNKQAKIAGGLMGLRATLGLSPGDWSCLALAIALKAPVYTTEQRWRKLKLGVRLM